MDQYLNNIGNIDLEDINLNNAIIALRERVRARHCGDRCALAKAERDIKAQEPFSSQVQKALIGNSEGITLGTVTPDWVKERLQEKSGRYKAYHLFNPLESIHEETLIIRNRAQAVSHPIKPVVYIQNQAKTLFGVRLSARRIGELLVQFYGFERAQCLRDVEKVDLYSAFQKADIENIDQDESLTRPDLVNAIRRSIPSDVVTISEMLAREGE
ncbi:hypothetical protein MACH09_45200 [Vibrio sp. MACH09]|nr:hypothetical protein MACH09_45200 [Vibrio sp. MACH09]